MLPSLWLPKFRPDVVDGTGWDWMANGRLRLRCGEAGRGGDTRAGPGIGERTKMS